MGKLKYLVIHTADTPFNREVTPDDLTMWHMGAKPNGDGTYTYLSKRCSKSDLVGRVLTLPSGKTVPVLQTNGRGWSTTGYADLIQRSGALINLNPYDFDDNIEKWEVTNGVANMNSQIRNVVLAGGWSKENQFGSGTGVVKDGHHPKTKKYLDISDLYTQEQIETLKKYVLMQLQLHPDLIIVGHNNLSYKTCPNFDVQEFIEKYLPGKGIHTQKLSKR